MKIQKTLKLVRKKSLIVSYLLIRNYAFHLVCQFRHSNTVLSILKLLETLRLNAKKNTVLVFVDVVSVSDRSKQIFPLFNNLQKNEAERNRRQEIRDSVKILQDAMCGELTDAQQNSSLSSTVVAACNYIGNLEKEDENNKLEHTRLSMEKDELQRKLDFLLGYDR